MRSQTTSGLVPYVLAVTITGTCVLLISLVVLNVWQALLLASGCAALVWVAVFTFVQFSQFTKQREHQGSQKRERNINRRVILGPASGESYPHHEDHSESPGQDQGQLTSHLPGSTPFGG
jgi:FlaA1/EpsC-like NDP-sugar epimerase